MKSFASVEEIKNSVDSGEKVFFISSKNQVVSNKAGNLSVRFNKGEDRYALSSLNSIVNTYGFKDFYS